jgi:ER lumen protein retaining receptor
MGSKRDSPVNVLSGWLRNRSMKVKIFLGILLAFCAVVALKLTIKDLEFFYIASNTIHIVGLIALVYKLYVHKSCSGKFLNFSSLIGHCLIFCLLEKIVIALIYTIQR